MSFTTAREMMLKNQKELEQGWRRHALDEEEEEEVPRCSGGLYHVSSNGRLVEREDAEEEGDLRAAILGAPRSRRAGAIRECEEVGAEARSQAGTGHAEDHGVLRSGGEGGETGFTRHPRCQVGR